MLCSGTSVHAPCARAESIHQHQAGRSATTASLHLASPLGRKAKMVPRVVLLYQRLRQHRAQRQVPHLPPRLAQRTVRLRARPRARHRRQHRAATWGTAAEMMATARSASPANTALQSTHWSVPSVHLVSMRSKRALSSATSARWRASLATRKISLQHKSSVATAVQGASVTLTHISRFLSAPLPVNQ